MDPMTAVGVGALMSGAGSLASMFGSRKKGPSAKDLRRDHQYWRWREEQAIPLRVEGAKTAGLHPLTAIGLSPGSAPVVTNTRKENRADRISRSLKGMGQSFQDYQDAQLLPLRKDILKEQKRALEIENDLKDPKKRQVADINREGVIKGQPNTQMSADWFSRHVDYKNPEIVKKVTQDITAGVSAADRWVNKRGVYQLLPTEEHAEAVGEMIMPQIADAVIDIVDRAKLGAGGLFFPGKIKKEIIRLRKSLEKQVGIPKGMEYQFNPFFRGFVIKKKVGKGKLTVTDNLYDQSGNRKIKPTKKWKGKTRKVIKRRMRHHPLAGKKAK